MAFALMSRPKHGAPVSTQPERKRKPAPGQRTIDSQPGLKPMFWPQSMVSASVIQAKLKIGEPNDKLEQETDRVADEVVRMPDLEAQVSAIRGGGQPLPQPLRAFFEPRFGYDFSQVRIHTDMRADESARAVGALAYTVGHHVVFGAGQYTPSTGTGQRLLAHELTHVMQQAQADGQKAGIVNHPMSPFEAEADRTTAAANIGQPVQVVATGALPVMQRQEGKKRPTVKPKEEKPKEVVLKDCPKGWTPGIGSAWRCNEPGMGTTCERCGVQLDSWPEKDECRVVDQKGTPRTCPCDLVLQQIGTDVAAFKDPMKCGGMLQVMRRSTGDIKTVTVVDEGPFKPGRIIDLHESVFGLGLSFREEVCVPPYQSETDNRLHICWEGFAKDRPKKTKKGK